MDKKVREIVIIDIIADTKEFIRRLKRTKDRELVISLLNEVINGLTHLVKRLKAGEI